MELLLRLRANVLWPAMHSCSQAFWDNKDNLPIAKKYDIALGSSHCEQMLRDNEWEWRRYDNNSGTNENWNYVTNKAKIQRYWEERVEESKGFSAMYTLGMRGVHDWGISGYPTTQDKVRGLTEIIDFQRSLLDLTTRADDNHAPPVFSIAISPSLEPLDRCQDLVRFFALLRIKPHAPPLVRAPVNSFEFHSCERTTQAEYLLR